MQGVLQLAQRQIDQLGRTDRRPKVLGMDETPSPILCPKRASNQPCQVASGRRKTESLVVDTAEPYP